MNVIPEKDRDAEAGTLWRSCLTWNLLAGGRGSVTGLSTAGSKGLSPDSSRLTHPPTNVREQRVAHSQVVRRSPRPPPEGVAGRPHMYWILGRTAPYVGASSALHLPALRRGRPRGVGRPLGESILKDSPRCAPTSSSPTRRGSLINQRYAPRRQEAQKPLRTQRPERSSGPFGPGCLYTSLRSQLAYSLPYAELQVCSGQASRVRFGGRAAHTTESMAHHKRTRQEYSRRSAAGTQRAESSEFPSRVPVVPVGSLPNGNSQTARQRLDTSLSSRSSRRSLGYHRHVERLLPEHAPPTLSNHGNYGNSGRKPLHVFWFVSSRQFRTQRELRELRPLSSRRDAQRGER